MRGRVAPTGFGYFKEDLAEGVEPFPGGAPDLAEQNQGQQEILAILEPGRLLIGPQGTKQDAGGGNRAGGEKGPAALPGQWPPRCALVTQHLGPLRRIRGPGL